MLCAELFAVKYVVGMLSAWLPMEAPQRGSARGCSIYISQTALSKRDSSDRST